MGHQQKRGRSSSTFCEPTTKEDKCMMVFACIGGKKIMAETTINQCGMQWFASPKKRRWLHRRARLLMPFQMVLGMTFFLR